jgi:RimJ/RimL family protein N-acetyltransferase
MLTPPGSAGDVAHGMEALSAGSEGRAWSIRAVEGRAIGIAVDHRDHRRAEIRLVVVLRREWGKGYGAEILAAIREGLEAEGPTEVLAQIRSTNERARAAAERAGFMFSGTTDRQGMEQWVSHSSMLTP